MNLLTTLLIIIICVSLISNLTMTGGGSNSGNGCEGHIKSSVRYENIPSETLINDTSSSTE